MLRRISGATGQPLLFPGSALKAGLTISVYVEDLSANDLMGSTNGGVANLSLAGYTVPGFGGVLSLAFRLQ